MPSRETKEFDAELLHGHRQTANGGTEGEESKPDGEDVRVVDPSTKEGLGAGSKTAPAGVPGPDAPSRAPVNPDVGPTS